jgi:anti-sigma regulatory factor (Ser/Thr protein kinase)
VSVDPEDSGVWAPLGDLLLHHSFSPIEDPKPAEDRIWSEIIEPKLPPMADGALRCLHYGCTEMLNNAIHHSGGWHGFIFAYFKPDDGVVTLMIQDNGIGAFEKLRLHFGLEDYNETILELSKGKLTTDPKEHSGQGLFFSSRMFDLFHLTANQCMIVGSRRGAWAMNTRAGTTWGTIVVMSIKADSERTPKETFDVYAPPEGDFEFSRTNLILKLAQELNMRFVSRSEAKRLVARLENFKEVWVDFEGVDLIYPSFADEMFRVFPDAHPDTTLTPINANPDVSRMVQGAASRRRNPPAS